MRIYVPVPGLAPHGGIRVIIDIANWLADRGHEVHLHPLQEPCREDMEYWRFSRRLQVGHPGCYPPVSLITSPHSVDLGAHRRSVVHLQMLESMFRPNDKRWAEACRRTYAHPGRLLSISKWNVRALLQERTGKPTSYMGNGVDRSSFPLREVPHKHSEPTVLVEGWAAYNPTKDVKRVAPQACAALRKAGVRVVAYGGFPPSDWTEVYDEFHVRPDLNKLNVLYESAWVLLKASLYDARSCSPVEAMTKGTPTVRVIRMGDDDLDDSNSVRLNYDQATPNSVAYAVLSLLEDESRRRSLATAGYAHLALHCNWERWGEVIESALKDPNGYSPLPGELSL